MGTVALAVTDGMQHLELALACEVLAAPWYEVVICGSGVVRAGGLFRLEPNRGLDQLAEADTAAVAKAMPGMAVATTPGMGRSDGANARSAADRRRAAA